MRRPPWRSRRALSGDPRRRREAPKTMRSRLQGHTMHNALKGFLRLAPDCTLQSCVLISGIRADYLIII